MKQLFNFYLEDSDKKAAIEKLKRLKGDNSKGQLAAYLRVMIKLFIATPDEKVNKDILEAVDAEYVYNTYKNKRSYL